MSRTISIHEDHLVEIIKAVETDFPLESCGIIAGKNDLSIKVFPIKNNLHSKTRFQMAPDEQIKALLEIENRGWELLCIYHSHPTGPPHPSATDIAEATYPEAVNLIFSPLSERWGVKGFIIENHVAKEIDLVVLK